MQSYRFSKLSPVQGIVLLVLLLSIPVGIFFLTKPKPVADVRSRAATTSECTATGGTITVSGEYCVHTFTANGTFTPACSTNAEVLVVGGGGGGGSSMRSSQMIDGCNGDWGGSGGGGGGGVLYESAYSLTTGTSIPVTVGAGGIGGAINTGQRGTNGGNSVFGTLTAIGGGGGAGVSSARSSGLVGGSGGGAGYECITFRCRDGAAGTAGQGNSGGQSCYPYGGGGGGAGSSANGMHGGIGIASSITGTETYYAGGGGGGGGGVGGKGGGGCKVSDYMCPPNGDSYTGGGGGGAYAKYKAGGNGGSGIVIVRYKPCGTSTVTGTPGSTGVSSCGLSCTAVPDSCPTGFVCVQQSDSSFRCRNPQCYGEADCVCYKIKDTPTPTKVPTVACNASCSTDDDCGSMICVDDNGTKKCRNAACYGKDNCICYSITNTPSPTPIPVVPCNASCSSDEDCGSKICVDVNGTKKCRNAACYGATNCICYSVTSTPSTYGTVTPTPIETPTPSTADMTLVPTSASMLVTDLLALSPTPGSFSSTTTANASPDITINSFYNSKKQANPLITLSGTSEPDAQLSITISPDGITGIVTADNLGNWEYTVPKKLSNGSKQLTILVRTARGGQTTKTETFTVVGGFQFPTAAVVFSLLIALGVGGYILYQKKLVASTPPPASYTQVTTPEFQPPEATVAPSPSAENTSVGSPTTQSSSPTDIPDYPASSVQHVPENETESLVDTGIMSPMPESLQPKRSDVELTDTASVDTAPVVTDQRLPTISSPDIELPQPQTEESKSVDEHV